MALLEVHARNRDDEVGVFVKDAAQPGFAVGEDAVVDRWRRGVIISRLQTSVVCKLVNMAEEQVSEQLTDEEIKNAVQDKRAGEQDREVNGGDDDNYVDKDPRPTRGEVLQASAILRRYDRESGDTFARQMETILGRFSCQTRLEQVNSLV
ncbi:hypothetical protein B0H19DRAFT_1080255 [Mycena capillaripes]|nr:hypothetical protein B0H19DRAFT_1080255 [Mycena capillaripes]